MTDLFVAEDARMRSVPASMPGVQIATADRGEIDRDQHPAGAGSVAALVVTTVIGCPTPSQRAYRAATAPLTDVTPTPAASPSAR